MYIAFVRGELDCLVTSDNSAMRDEQDGFLINLMTTGDKKRYAVPHLAILALLGVKVSKEMEAVHKAVTSGGVSVFMPPDVPPERLEYVRKVFKILSNNDELKKSMEKVTNGKRMPFVPGQELQQEMTEIKADKELVTKLEAIFKKYTAVR